MKCWHCNTELIWGGDFTYEEKKFVTPFNNNRIGAPDIIEDEPSGATSVGSGTEESHYSERDTGDGMRGF